MPLDLHHQALLGSTLFLLLAVACGAPPGRPPNDGRGGTGKIAVVDIARILNETDRGREIQDQVDEAQHRVVAQLEDMRADLEELAHEIEAAQNAEPPDEAELQRLLGEYRESAERAQSAQQSAESEIDRFKQQLTHPLVADVRSLCERIGQDDGFDLIVDRSGAAYVEDAIDITDRIVRELEGSGSRALVREAIRASGGSHTDDADDAGEGEGEGDGAGGDDAGDDAGTH